MTQLVLAVLKDATAANLTTIGTTDWADWNGSLNAVTVNEAKSGGGGLISAAIFTAGSPQIYSGDPRTISWTDGSPTGTSSNSNGVFNSGGGVGAGFEVTFPADTSNKIATLYCGYFDSDVKVTAIISDASTGNQVDSTTLTGAGLTSLDGVITVTYAAASAGQTMKIRIEVLNNLNGSGNTTLQGAALKPGIASAPAGLGLIINLFRQRGA